MQQNNKKSNMRTKSKSSNKTGTKQNKFLEEIARIAKECVFDPNTILLMCQQHNISSSDFSLHKFQNKRTFTVEFCVDKCSMNIPKAHLIKLWKALNKKYNLLCNGPCYPISTDSSIWISKRLVYIPSASTKHIIDSQLIQEPFLTTKGLYQYLDWTIRINKIDRFINIFVTANGIKVLVINSELHDKNGNVLYMLCIENDIVSVKSQQWQFLKLMTEHEIMELFSIKSNELPLGARSNGAQFDSVRTNKLRGKGYILNGRLSQNKYRQLRCIRTVHDRAGEKKGQKKPLQVALYEFYECINAALISNDPKHDLVPIVSILTGKKYPEGQYTIDQVLPVEIDGEWIGIAYRDGLPVMTLVDGYDITNKAILCDPAFDRERLEWFSNNISKIEIVSNSSRRSSPNKKLQPEKPRNNQFDDKFNTQIDREYAEFGDKMGYGQFDDNQSQFNHNKLNNNNNNNNIYTEGDQSVTSTNNNTINHIDTAPDGAINTMNNNGNNPTNFSVAAVATNSYQYQTASTVPSIGSYQFRGSDHIQQQTQTQYTTTATNNYILPSQPQPIIPLEGTNNMFQYYPLYTTPTTNNWILPPPQPQPLISQHTHINNLLQYSQQQAALFGQFLNTLNVPTVPTVNNVSTPSTITTPSH